MTNYVGNISTIIKLISMTIAGWLITTLAAQGLNLGVDSETLAAVIGAIIMLGLGYIDAKYPNTFQWLGNQPNPIPDPNDYPETCLNEDYEFGDADDC